MKKNHYVGLASILLLICIGLLGLMIFQKEAPEKVYLVGVINYSPAAEPAFDGFRQAMTDLGYIEGKNIRYMYVGHINDKTMLEAEGERLAASGCDMIFSMSTPATLTAQRVTAQTKIPVVFGPVSNPVASGIVKDLKKPGGNLTGVTFSYQEPKRLELLKRIVPSARRVCFPYNPNDRSPTLNLERLGNVAEKLQVKLVPYPLKDDQEITEFLAHLPTDIDAIFMPTDSLMASRIKEFATVALKHRVPLSTPQREGVLVGGLVSYGFSLDDVGRQAARLADQIFRGVPPADLPVEVSEFVPTINLRTADAIGVRISDSILRQAIVVRE